MCVVVSWCVSLFFFRFRRVPSAHLRRQTKIDQTSTTRVWFGFLSLCNFTPQVPTRSPNRRGQDSCLYFNCCMYQGHHIMHYSTSISWCRSSPEDYVENIRDRQVHSWLPFRRVDWCQTWIVHIPESEVHGQMICTVAIHGGGKLINAHQEKLELFLILISMQKVYLMKWSQSFAEYWVHLCWAYCSRFRRVEIISK